MFTMKDVLEWEEATNKSDALLSNIEDHLRVAWLQYKQIELNKRLKQFPYYVKEITYDENIFYISGVDRWGYSESRSIPIDFVFGSDEFRKNIVEETKKLKNKLKQRKRKKKNEPNMNVSEQSMEKSNVE